MAIEMSVSIDFAVPRERVVAVLTDPPSWSAWMPNLVRVDMHTDGPFGVGTRFDEVRKMFGKEASEHFEVVRYDPPDRYDLFVDGSKGSTGKGEYLFVHTLTETPEGTRLTIDGTISKMGFFGEIFGRLFKGTFAKMMRKDLEALKAHLEAG